MKRILKTFLLSILLVMTLGTAAQAKDVCNYKAITTKQNTWYKPKGDEFIDWYYNSTDEFIREYNKYRYKVTVPANYYMKLTVKCNGSNTIYLHDALKAEYYNGDYYATSSAYTYNIALPKGTYYFGASYNDNKLAFKYKLCKYANKPNYKSTKALNWKANKKLAIVQMPGHNYTRWYKIKLTKKKRVYIWGADRVAMLDAKHQFVKVVKNNNADGYAFASYAKLKPGTYYIAFPWKWEDDGYFDDCSVEIVWWK